MGGLGTRVGDAGGASGKCDHPPTDSVQSANVRRWCAGWCKMRGMQSTM